MRTVIRLQNKGCRNHPYWWIVIQGSYKKLKGRFVEHVGYWIPRQTKTVQRAVILNKPRLQYWLAVGAQPSRTVQKMLSFVNLMPKPYIPFGSKYLYEKAPKSTVPKPYPGLERFDKTNEDHVEARKREEMNLIERELKAQFEIEKQVKFDKSDIDKVELVESDIEDSHKRTQTFFDLRKTYLELEKDSQKLSSAKKEILFRKMNKLASQGLVDISKKNPEQVLPLSPRERVEKEVKIGLWKEMVKEQHKKALHDQEMLKPITSEEMLNHVMQHSAIPLNRAKDKINEVFEDANKRGIILSKQDAKEAVMSTPNDMNITDLLNVDSKRKLIPTKRPITPFPNIEDYDPQNFYDSRVSYSLAHNPNKAYESNSRIVPTQEKNFRYRYKNQKGRTTKVRVTFSTLNKPTNYFTPTVLKSNMATAYTGLMRKIQSTW